MGVRSVPNAERFTKVLRKTAYFSALIYTFAVYGPMAAMSIGAGIILLSALLLMRDHKFVSANTTEKNLFLAPSIALAIACAFSLIVAQLLPVDFYGLHPNITYLEDLRKLWHLGFPFIFAFILSRLASQQLKQIYVTWLGLGFLTGCLGIIQHYIPLYLPMELPDDGLRGYYHATGMTGFHLSFASIISFPTASWIALTAVSLRRRSVGMKTSVSQRRALAFATASIVMIAANILTYSKMAWLAVPLMIILLSVLGFKGKIRWAILSLVVVLGLLWSVSPEVRLRFHGTDTIRDRIQIWTANKEMIRKYPLFGVGWHHNSELSEGYYSFHGIKGFQSHAHNNFIDQWATTGFFGLAAFLWWCTVAFVVGFRIYRSDHNLLWRSFGLGLIGGWFCLQINGLTQTNFWDAKVMHQIGWVTALSMEVYRRRGTDDKIGTAET